MAKDKEMCIQITKDYRITSDPLNIIVEKLITPKAKEGEEAKEPYWVADNGYYPNLETACVGILNRKINKSSAQSIHELKVYIGEIKEEIIQAVKDR